MTPERMLWEMTRWYVTTNHIDMGAGKRTRHTKIADIRACRIYRQSTSLCPVCKTRIAKRETCGSDECVAIWTIGYVPIYYQKWTWKDATR